MPKKIHIEPGVYDIIEVGDIKYSAELLEMGFDVGAIIRLIKKGDCDVTFERLYELEDAKETT